MPSYDPSKGQVMDLAVAQQVSEASLSVCSIDLSPKLIRPNNYGVWVDEFEAMDLNATEAVNMVELGQASFLFFDFQKTDEGLRSEQQREGETERLFKATHFYDSNIYIFL